MVAEMNQLRSTPELQSLESHWPEPTSMHWHGFEDNLDEWVISCSLLGFWI
jgi:hypothetical protein